MLKKVGEFILRDLTSVAADTSIKEVVKLLSFKHLTGMPVVNEKNEVMGYISEVDIIKALFPERIDTDNIIISLDKLAQILKRTDNIGDNKIESIMNPHPVVVTEDTLIADAIELILKYDLSNLPVTRNNFLVGSLPRANICQFLVEVD
jgi:predicted transcriptional regulator